MEFSQIILTPFSWLLTFFHDVFGNYGIALILFAIIVKAILFPFSLKGKRSMIQMTMIQGKVQKIQQQYANNREKMNEEIQKLYAKENVKPMSGCLWSFIPLLILWPLYAIIRRPLFYMMGQSVTAIEAIASALNFTVSNGTVSSGYNELYLASMINSGNLDAVRSAAEGVSAGLGDKLFVINFNFLGLDLSQVAQWKIWDFDVYSWATIGLFLLPIISAGLSLLMSWVSQKTNSVNNNQANSQANKQMRTMMLISPLISLWIGYAMPAGLCVYWIINNVLSIAQEFISGRILKKDYERAAAARAEQERLEKEEEKRKKREAAERRAKAAEEAKLNKGKKKPVEKTEKKNRTTDAGRIGMRPYARGRSYDPDRYGGVTPYQDPGAPIDEEALEEALAAKGLLQEQEPEEETAQAEAPAEEITPQQEEEPAALSDGAEEDSSAEEAVEEAGSEETAAEEESEQSEDEQEAEESDESEELEEDERGEE